MPVPQRGTEELHVVTLPPILEASKEATSTNTAQYQPALTLELSAEQTALLKKTLLRQSIEEVTRLQKANWYLSNRLEIAEEQLKNLDSVGAKVLSQSKTCHLSNGLELAEEQLRNLDSFFREETSTSATALTVANPRKPDDQLNQTDEHPAKQVLYMDHAVQKTNGLIDMNGHTSSQEILDGLGAAAQKSLEGMVGQDVLDEKASFEAVIIERWSSMLEKLIELEELEQKRWQQEIQMHSSWLKPMDPDARAANRGSAFRNSTMTEFHVEEAAPLWCILHPQSSVALSWQLASLMVIMWDLIMIPLQQFELGSVDKQLDVVGYITSAYWFCDLILNFFKGHELDNGLIEMRLASIAKHYARSWLLPDLVIVGADFFIIAVSLEASSGSSSAVRSTRIMRTPRLLRLVRLLRVHRIKKAFIVVANKISNMYVLLCARVFSGLLLLLLVNHFIACAWIALGQAEFEGRSWIKELPVAEELEISEIYISALHWSITQFMPATNDIAPNNGIERLFTVVVIMFAMGVFSSFISSITNAVNSLREVRNEQIRRETILRKFFSERNLSTDLFLTIQDFCQKADVSTDKIQEQQVELLRETPESIQIRLHAEMFMPALTSAKWLVDPARNLDNQLLSCLCHFSMAERICQPQFEVFIPDGEVCSKVIVPLNSNLSYSLEGQNYDTVPAWTWVCEYALWATWKHCGALVSHRTSRYIEVSVEEFCNQVSRSGGPLYEYLQTFGVLLVGVLEAMIDDGVPLTDLPCDDDTIDNLTDRALRWKRVAVRF